MHGADIKRIRSELKAVGVGIVGMQTPEANELVKILHPDEHIGGVVYGGYIGGLAWLVATNRRVLFIDKKPLFSTTDELSYDVVSGVKSTKTGLSASVTLHTRVHEYTIRFVTPTCARTFVEFIENRRLESGNNIATNHQIHTNTTVPAFQNTSDEGLDFLKSHDLAVLSTVDRTGNVHGAIVYYLIDKRDFIYILTKSETGKGRNIYAHSQVALTVHEPNTQQTVQLQGIAEVETDQLIKERVFGQIVNLRSYQDGPHLPPVTKLHDGAFMIIRITPTIISFHDYAKVE